MLSLRLLRGVRALPSRLLDRLDTIEHLAAI